MSTDKLKSPIPRIGTPQFKLPPHSLTLVTSLIDSVVQPDGVADDAGLRQMAELADMPQFVGYPAVFRHAVVT